MLTCSVRPKLSHRDFARRISTGMLSQTQAYLLTYPKCRSRAVAAAAASRLKNHPDVQSCCQEFRREVAEYLERQREAAWQREKAMMDANFARMLRG
jgi:hypothetical protein